jgi:hypothetical protein
MKLYEELIACFFYIYMVVCISILIPPNVVILILLFIYAFISTILIYYAGNCKLFKSIIYLIVFIYALLCVVAFISIHTIYYEYPKYHFILVASPLIYFILIKTFESLFLCNNASVVNWGIKFISNIFNKIKSKIIKEEKK